MSAPPQRKVPRKEVPTTVQLDVTPSTMMLRGLVHRCPACGGRHLFRHWFRMEKRCPTCSMLFERVEGHWIGSIGLNTTVVFGVMLVVLLAGSLAFYPNPPYGVLLIAEISLPSQIILDEYVSIAHAFFEGAEPKFINGLLDAVSRDVRAG